MESFSKRNNFQQAEPDISIREDAPLYLRNFIINIVYELGYKPSFLRSILCRTLKIMPNKNNWSEYPNINGEVEDIFNECKWFEVYDIIENIYKSISQDYRDIFTKEINELFISKGIGWKLNNGIIEIRGDKVFEQLLMNVETTLDSAKLITSKSEMNEAINDLSRRPNPDITGAIQHSLACIECVCREVTGDKNLTLGELMKKHPDIVPPPLSIVISKIWGFSSMQGRHLQEGNDPEFIEAELLVGLTSSLCIYLAKKITTKTSII